MIKDYFISIYLDTRRAKKNAKFPVKLRVFTSHPRRQKLYATGFEFTSQEFTSIWETTKPRQEYRETRMQLQAIEANALKLANQIEPFSLEDFELRLLGIQDSGRVNVNFYYQKTIEQLRLNHQIGTASSYELSLKSLLQFYRKSSLSFDIITPQWLKDYERFMIEVKKRTQTTVGIYLRPLRAIYNAAIADKIIEGEKYPFGKRKYAIPSPKKVKKVLTNEDIKLLFESEPKTPEQQKAKAFWFFSYACNGMNFKDIAQIKFKDISKETIVFNRAKTANTNRDQAPVIVYLNDYTKSVIQQYGNTEVNPENYVFPIIDGTLTSDDKHRLIKNFVRFVNQNLRKLATGIGITESISTYWARHTFATNAIRNGASMEYVSEALSHSSLNTTRNYFAGFEDERKREMAKKLMNF